jgi:hypothetical protein
METIICTENAGKSEVSAIYEETKRTLYFANGCLCGRIIRNLLYRGIIGICKKVRGFLCGFWKGR